MPTYMMACHLLVLEHMRVGRGLNSIGCAQQLKRRAIFCQHAFQSLGMMFTMCPFSRQDASRWFDASRNLVDTDCASFATVTSPILAFAVMLRARLVMGIVGIVLNACTFILIACSESVSRVPSAGAALQKW